MSWAGTKSLGVTRSVNGTTKSAQDLVKDTKVISFQFYSREYMLRPETQEQIELLRNYLCAAGLNGVRLEVRENPWVSFSNQMHGQSAVTGERWLSAWGGKLWKSAPRKINRRDPSNIDVFLSGKSGWPIKAIGTVHFEEAVCYFWLTFGWVGLPQILAEEKSSSN